MPATRQQEVGRVNQVMVNAWNASGDLNNITFNAECETPEKTTFGDNTRRMSPCGLINYSVSHDGFFNDATTAGSPGIETILSTLGPGGSALVGVYPHGTGMSNLGYEYPAVLQSYQITSPFDGLLTMTATYSASGDVARAKSHGVTIATCTACGTGTTNSYDWGTNIQNSRWVLRVHTGSGTNASGQVIVQNSSNDAAWVTGITFTTLTSASFFESRTAASLSRYTRLSFTIGSSSDYTFHVAGGPPLLNSRTGGS